MLKTFVFIGLFVSAMMLLGSCGGKNADANLNGDSLLVDSDTVNNDSLEEDSLVEDIPVPKAADEYFNDFIYSFTSSKKFQYARIVFPLPYEKEGRQTFLARKQWQFSRFHTQEPYYTAFFSKESSIDLEKSTKISKVTIEYFYMDKGMVKDYCFSRDSDQWKMRKIREYSLEKYADKSFIRFFHKFAVDSVFQANHLEDEIECSIPEEDFEVMEGTIGAEQWETFKPELPGNVFTNIDYGQPMQNKNQRVVALEGASNGFFTLLFFRLDGGEWKLYKFKE